MNTDTNMFNFKYNIFKLNVELCVVPVPVPFDRASWGGGGLGGHASDNES
jgi:hypothetical protein